MGAMELSFSIYTPTKVYIRMNKHGCPCVYCNAYILVHTLTRTYIHTYIHTGTHSHTYIHTYIHTYWYTHTHVHTYWYTCTNIYPTGHTFTWMHMHMMSECSYHLRTNKTHVHGCHVQLPCTNKTHLYMDDVCKLPCTTTCTWMTCTLPCTNNTHLYMDDMYATMY